MTRLLVDTDVSIDHFQGSRAATAFICRSLKAGHESLISVVTVAEIMAGLRPGEELKTERLLGLFIIQVVDESMARIAGQHLKKFARSHGLQLGDALVAATAKVQGAYLVTRNLKHCPMTDLTLVEPYQRGVP